MPSCKSRKILVLQIWGKRGSKMGFFKVFSKPRLTIWFHLLEKEDNTILNMCAKLKVQVIFRSRDRGSNGMKMGQKWVFHGFLENYSVDLIPSPRERRFCNSTYVCQGAGAGYFSSPRYRVKWGSKWVPQYWETQKAFSYILMGRSMITH